MARRFDSRWESDVRRNRSFAAGSWMPLLTSSRAATNASLRPDEGLRRPRLSSDSATVPVAGLPKGSKDGDYSAFHSSGRVNVAEARGDRRYRKSTEQDGTSKRLCTTTAGGKRKAAWPSASARTTA